MEHNIWLSAEILKWEGYPWSSKTIDKKLKNRSYDLLQAGEISCMKDSMDHRLKQIESLYHFNNVFLLTRGKDYLTGLAELGLVQPLILNYLLKLKNTPGDDGENFKDIQNCYDAVWYFLKSTDPLLQTVNIGFDFEFELSNGSGIEIDYGYSVNADFVNHRELKISGWLPKEMISEMEIDGYIKVKTVEKDQSIKFQMEDFHDVRLTSDQFIDGVIKPAPCKEGDFSSYMAVLRRLFSLT